MDWLVNTVRRELVPRLRRLREPGVLPEMRDARLPVYMHPIEWSQIAALLSAAQPRRVLEWGTGGSTRALLERGDSIESLVAIEHDARWAHRVRRHVQDPRLALHCVPPAVAQPERRSPLNLGREDAYFAWVEACEDDPSIMADYVARPGAEGGLFDFILVDGRARTHCWRTGYGLLAPGGVMVMHDAQRARYQTALATFGEVTRLEPYKRGQVAFVRKPA